MTSMAASCHLTAKCQIRDETFLLPSGPSVRTDPHDHNVIVRAVTVSTPHSFIFASGQSMRTGTKSNFVEGNKIIFIIICTGYKTS